MSDLLLDENICLGVGEFSAAKFFLVLVHFRNSTRDFQKRFFIGFFDPNYTTSCTCESLRGIPPSKTGASEGKWIGMVLSDTCRGGVTFMIRSFQ